MTLRGNKTLFYIHIMTLFYVHMNLRLKRLIIHERAQTGVPPF